MKQDFSLFVKRAGRVLLLTVLLLSPFFTGCHEPFDDTKINNRLDALEKRMEKLEADYRQQMEALRILASMQEAITALQASVAKNEGDINDLTGDIADLTGDIADLTGDVADLTGDVADLTEEMAALTEEITALAKALGTSESEILKALDDLRKGLATVEETVAKLGFTISDYKYDEETGKCQIVLSNGAVIELMARDNAVDAVRVRLDRDGKLYWELNGEYLLDDAGNKIPVSVTPAVQINPDTNELEISVDGGKTWYSTGVFQSENGDEVEALFSSVSSDGTNVYFTMADGTVFTVPLTQPEIEIVISARKIYVLPEETKTVGVTMRNVEKYILVKPEGWRASIVGEIMSVTAPAKGVGEETGFIQIFAVSKDGRSVIEELRVVSGAPDLAVVAEDGFADITVNGRSAADETWLGYIFGVEILSEENSLEAIYEREAGNFDPETSEVIRESRTGIDMAEYVGPIHKDVDYVVWAVGIDRHKGDDGRWVTVLHSFEEMHHAIYCDEFKPVTEIVGLRENWSNGEPSIRPSWIGDEKITVMDQNASCVFAARGIADVDKVKFVVSEGSGISSMSAIAVYPSGKFVYSVSDAAAEVDVNYQSIQYAVEGSYDPNAYMAVAYNPDVAADGRFSFMNMPALLKFRVEAGGQPIVRLMVTSAGGEAISGAMTVRMDGKNVNVTEKVGAESQVEVIARHGFKAGNDYYLAVAPAVLSEGVTVCLNNDADNVYAIPELTVVERNKVYDLGTFEIKEEEVVVPPVQDNTPEGKQWVWRDSDLGCKRVFDLGKSRSGYVIIADNYEDRVKEGGKLPVDPITGELGYDENLVGKWTYADEYSVYSLTKIDETSGFITFSQTMNTVWGASTSYFRVEYTNYTGKSVSLLSPDPFLDSEGNRMPVLDADGNPVTDISNYPLYWGGVFPDPEAEIMLPIELTLSDKDLEIVNENEYNAK